MQQPNHNYAVHILSAFDAYHDTFVEITRRAPARFIEADWQGFADDAVERLSLYGKIVDQTVSELDVMVRQEAGPIELWAFVKQTFSGIIAHRRDYHLAETFFNSVTRRLFQIMGVNAGIEFTVDDFTVPAIEYKPCPVCTVYGQSSDNGDSVESIVGNLFSACKDRLPLFRFDRDVDRVARVISHEMTARNLPDRNIRLEIADPVFYRDKAAYIVGRILSGDAVVPLVISLLNVRGEIFVDAVLMDEDNVSILFSFARSYFHVDVGNPAEMIQFLKSIIPRKPVSELYTTLGYHKHGKAELFRELIRNLEDSREQFEIARGDEGMVMLVFTTPSFDVVFKIIKDHFDYPKQTTTQHIRDRYELVFRHDRAGRLVDAQEFDHLKLDRSRFSPHLIDELANKAHSKIIFMENHLVIRHLYTERRLTPLNLYIRQQPEAAVIETMIDYGWAIRDLAAANIFPGDLFLKNFGVTRHGRVVFYDYDELCLLTECNFRTIPRAETVSDQMADEQWFPVYENDVFPEEFKRYMAIPECAQSDFYAVHGDLFDVAFWKNMQEKVRSQALIHIFPYRKDRRLKYRFKPV
ncbi:MAG: bifunctional isocitrate dehydrogenase kinase/phosphatase [Thermodesulfobacteriota bacterium]